MTTGIVRCDMIADSILAASSAMGGFRMPVIIRLQGTNSDQGSKLASSYISSLYLYEGLRQLLMLLLALFSWARQCIFGVRFRESCGNGCQEYKKLIIRSFDVSKGVGIDSNIFGYDIGDTPGSGASRVSFYSLFQKIVANQ